MNGTLTPSGSYWKVDGTYTCVANTQSGSWTGTLGVRPPFMLRDEVLLIDDSACVYNQSTSLPRSPRIAQGAFVSRGSVQGQITL